MPAPSISRHRRPPTAGPAAAHAAAAAAVQPLLAALDPEQRAAASLPDGPALIIAPAGSGKTTTLIARLGVLLARGVPAARIAVATFNRDAATELSERIRARLAPLLPGAAGIEVRTLHALARQVVLDARGPTPLLADRLPILRSVLRRAAAEANGNEAEAPLPEPTELDADISALKVEGKAPARPDLVAAYAAMLAARGAIDFDDLVAGAVAHLEEDATLRLRWQQRFSHLCVDEFQDVDAGQLRLVRILAEPQRNLFVVGDDDQTIYAWRLADVRRILSFPDQYPGTHRVQLATNYRCPAPVVTASRILIEVNRERFAKRIGAAPGAATEHALAALDTSDEAWADRLAASAALEARAGHGFCVLARTRSELGPVLLALARGGVPHTTSLPAAIQHEPVRAIVADARGAPASAAPFDTLMRLRSARGWRRSEGDAIGDDDHAALDALLGWAVGFRHLDAFLAAHDRSLARLEALRRPDAMVELVTVHGAKGREWPTVVVLGMEEDRFPNRRSLLDAADPGRALEEERRLAYVALTRATRRLILAFDPARPSRFLAEMGVAPRPTGRPRPPPA